VVKEINNKDRIIKHGESLGARKINILEVVLKK